MAYDISISCLTNTSKFHLKGVNITERKFFYLVAQNLENITGANELHVWRHGNTDALGHRNTTVWYTRIDSKSEILTKPNQIQDPINKMAGRVTYVRFQLLV